MSRILNTIRGKLIAINLLVSLIIALLYYVFTTFYFSVHSKQNLVDNTTLSAKFIAEYIALPLTFNDTAFAKNNILSKLYSIPDVEAAFICDNNNNIFAEYNPFNIPYQVTSSNLSGKTEFRENYLIVTEHVFNKEDLIGKVVMIVSTNDYYIAIKRFFIVSLALTFLLVVLSFVISIGLQRIISVPILKLAKFMQNISDKGDYSLRIKQRESDDEINKLYRGFNDVLEQLNRREQERDYAIKDLKSAKENAENADTLKSAFLTNMSHEIRTPMNAILGFSGLLSEPELTQKDKEEYLGLIRKSGTTLLQLIDDIIDISKIEAGELRINRIVVDVKKMLNNIYLKYSKEVELQEDKEGLLIKVEDGLPGDVFTVYSDPLRLQQVLDNLMSNALKFTEQGSITLGCRLSNNGKVLFWVQDTGIGIGDKAREIIFERFRKEEKDKTKIYRGTGLGLAISKNLVEMLGGTIWIESEEGKGTTFYFNHPAASKTNEVLQHSSKAAKKENDIMFLMSKKLLIVEDEFSNFMYLKELLKKTGAEITWARDGEEAINFVKKGDFDLILMDIKMPKMNGYRATKIIKSMKNIPVIAQTAYAMSGEKEESENAGCDAYISKPIRKEELLDIMAGLLAK